MVLDKETKREIAAVVFDAVIRALEGAEEKWMTADALCEQFQFLSPSWLKRHGKHLSPTRAIVIDEKGKPHQTGLAYPMHKIQRMIQENRMVFYETAKVQYRSSGRA